MWAGPLRYVLLAFREYFAALDVLPSAAVYLSLIHSIWELPAGHFGDVVALPLFHWLLLLKTEGASHFCLPLTFSCEFGLYLYPQEVG